MRKFISLLLVAALIVTLSACGGAAEPTEAPTQPVVQVELETQPDLRPYLGVELSMLSMLSETDPAAEVLRQAAEVFEETTGAAVTLQFLAGDEQALAEKLSGGVKTDIFTAWIDDLDAGYSAYALDQNQMGYLLGGIEEYEIPAAQ